MVYRIWEIKQDILDKEFNDLLAKGLKRVLVVISDDSPSLSKSYKKFIP